MTNSKKRLADWIRLFVDIALQINDSGFRISISTGQSLLLVPADVFKVLKNRDLLLHSADRDFIEYESAEAGMTLIQIEINPDKAFAFKLILKEKT